jgi:DNA-binding response OmpR family regulator
MQHEDLGSPMSPRYSGHSNSPRPGTEARPIYGLGPQILLLDPDPLTRDLLTKYLRDKGFDIIATADTETPPQPVDLLIVALDDVKQSPKIPGWLSDRPDTPTIILDRSYEHSGRADPPDFVPHARLSLPVHPRKLVATIRRALSLARIESAEPHESPTREYRFSGWVLHRRNRRLESFDGKSALLTKLEFEVLKTLLTFPRQLLTRRQLIAIAWGPGKEVESRRLDYPVTRLRRHLGDNVKFPTLIKTVVGLGYRLDTEVEKIP